MKQALTVFMVCLVALTLFYISRFWPFALWSPQSPLTQLGLPPRGGLLLQLLRGTPLIQFELLIWLTLSFLTLTWTEKLAQRLKP